jgi:hypothetical protein
MKTELFEKLIRRIVREELDFYTSKLIKEISQITSKNLVSESGKTKNNSEKNTTVRLTSENASLKESLSGFKNELDKEYGFNNASMQFDGMEVPPELESVFNKDYRDFMKKVK